VIRNIIYTRKGIRRRPFHLIDANHTGTLFIQKKEPRRTPRIISHLVIKLNLQSVRLKPPGLIQHSPNLHVIHKFSILMAWTISLPYSLKELRYRTLVSYYISRLRNRLVSEICFQVRESLIF